MAPRRRSRSPTSRRRRSRSPRRFAGHRSRRARLPRHRYGARLHYGGLIRNLYHALAPLHYHGPKWYGGCYYRMYGKVYHLNEFECRRYEKLGHIY